MQDDMKALVERLRSRALNLGDFGLSVLLGEAAQAITDLSARIVE
jgi:hypothetical protein